MGLPYPQLGETSPLWGVEATFDLAGCDPDTIGDGDAIKRFATGLCKAIDMNPFGEPVAVRFALDNPDAAGYSLTQLITTSLISGHFSEKRRTAYLNVFSCKWFDVDAAEAFIVDFFSRSPDEPAYCYRQVQRRGTHEPA